MRSRLAVVVVGSFITAVLAGFGAGAQTAPEAVKEACRSSVISLCRPEALSGDRASMRACLVRNFDKAEPACQAAIKTARAHAAEMHTPTAPLKP